MGNQDSTKKAMRNFILLLPVSLISVVVARNFGSLDHEASIVKPFHVERLSSLVDMASPMLEPCKNDYGDEFCNSAALFARMRGDGCGRGTPLTNGCKKACGLCESNCN